MTMDINLQEIVKEELVRLGIHENVGESLNNKVSYNYGSRILGFTNNNFSLSKEISKFTKTSSSPRNCHEANGIEQCKTPIPNRLKSSSVSPFSRKSRFERKSWNKKKESANNSKSTSASNVFGVDLELLPLSSTELQDGSPIQVPQLIIDVNDIVRENVKVEGIFRKAGSSHRQNELKKLLNSGQCLSSSVHPIDAACLLKHFLRALPSPLLSYHVHFLMTKCLDLPEDEQKEALSLCSLLLSKRIQDLLAYILELFSCVCLHSDENQMTSRNLAIVLAPNLLPATKEFGRKRNVWSDENALLCSTIDVIQRLIEGSNGICRVSQKLVCAAEQREKSRSMEHLDSAPADGNPKKRRSGTLNSKVHVPHSALACRSPKKRRGTLNSKVNGFLRRIVQGNSSQVGQRAPLSSNSSNVVQEVSAPVSMDPEGRSNLNVTPSKRKSDIFEMDQITDEVVPLLPKRAADRPVKKPKIEWNRGASNRLNNPSRRFFNVKVKGEESFESVKRRYSLREKKGSPNPASSSTDVRRRKSSVSIPIKNSGVSRSRVGLGHSKTDKTCETDIKISGISRSRVGLGHSSTVKTRETDNKKLGAVKSPRSKLNDRRTSHDLKCSQKSTRISDKKSPMELKQGTPDQLNTLEQQYCDIKSVIENIEKDVDENNLKDLRKEIGQSSLGNKSCSQLIHDAYERMKMETESLDCSPSENLTRRLGRELKIRSRRSDEYRVFRSPSERRIESIRRRSKELEQSASKPGQEESCQGKMAEPRIKSGLTPQVSLKRGKPNSLKSGLPLLLKSPAQNVRRDSIKRSSLRSSNGRICPLTPLSRHSGPVTRASLRSRGSLSTSPMAKGNTTFTVEPNNGSFTRGCTFLLSSSGKDLSNCNTDWVSASKFFNDSDTPLKNKHLNIEVSSNRPSIIALKQKKKVTSNIQLFNNSSEMPSDHFDIDPSSTIQPGVSNSNPNLTSQNIHRSPLTPIRTGDLRSKKSYSPNHGFRTPKSDSNHEFRTPKSDFNHGFKTPKSDFNHGFRTPKSEFNHVFKTPKSEFNTPRIMNLKASSAKSSRLKSMNLPSNITPLPSRPTRASITPNLTSNGTKLFNALPKRSSAVHKSKDIRQFR